MDGRHGELSKTTETALDCCRLFFYVAFRFKIVSQLFIYNFSLFIFITKYVFQREL